MDKAFKASLPHLPVADFKCYRSTGPFRVALPKDPYAAGDDGGGDDDD